jgi:membrane protease subunit HflK
MSWDNQSNDGKRKNPWGNRPGGGGGGNGGGGPRGPQGPQGPWGPGGPRRGNDGPPDIDEMLRRAQQNFRQVMPGGMGTGRVILLGGAALIALWLSSGFYTIEPGTHGVVQRFGAHERTKTTEGLAYRLPWPVETLTKVGVSQVRSMPIGYTDLDGRGTGKRDVPDESLMLTSDANIVDLDLQVQWNIKSAEEFIFNIRDPEATIKKVAESAIREVVGQTPMFSIMTNERVEVANRAKTIMAANLDAYKSGINITQVLINEAEVHPEVQAAFQDVQSAKQDAFNVQNQAQAYREDIIPKARGEAIKLVQEATAYKSAVVARANGDADRFNSVLEAYNTGQDVTRERMYIETMEAVLRNAQKIVIDEKGGSGVVPYLPLNELKPAAGTTPAKNSIAE